MDLLQNLLYYGNSNYYEWVTTIGQSLYCLIEYKKGPNQTTLLKGKIKVKNFI
jgi:hypothetical protein